MESEYAAVKPSLCIRLKSIQRTSNQVGGTQPCLIGVKRITYLSVFCHVFTAATLKAMMSQGGHG